MIFRNLDFLSPPITIYHKGQSKHSSVFSGLLTVLSYLMILACIIYYVIDFIEKTNPTSYFFNRYVEDTGIFPFNESSILHYISLIEFTRDRGNEFDFNSIMIYGIQISIENYIHNFDIASLDHWEYALCNYEEDISNIKLKNLIDKSIFNKSACIKKYYSSEEKRYFKKGESGFKFPTLEHGASHPNRTLYGIIVESCNNNSIKNDCNPKEKIEYFFSKHALSLNFIDHYVDVLNYNEPIEPYIYSITDGLTLSTTVTLNNLNFEPRLIRTHNGFFFDHLVEEKSYSFVQNEKMTINREEKNVVAAFYFWMQNNMIYNERHYKKFQDSLSNIGGLGSFILLIGFIINSFVNPYIIILDTQDLIFRIEEKNFIDDMEIKKISNFMKEKEDQKKTLFQNINNNIKNTLQISKLPLFINDKEESEKLESENLNIKNKNKNRTSLNLLNSNRLIKYKKINPAIKKNTLELFDDNRFKEIEINKSFFEIKDKNNQIIEKPIKKQKFSWCNYILYIMFFKNKNFKIKFYECFREQILSEESLMQNNLDIYKLLNHCNIKRTTLFSLIKLK